MQNNSKFKQIIPILLYFLLYFLKIYHEITYRYADVAHGSIINQTNGHSLYPLKWFHHYDTVPANHLKSKQLCKIVNIERLVHQILTTIPMLLEEPSLQSSIVSSMTTFINGSNPRKIPFTFLPAFSFKTIRLSMYLKTNSF